MAVEILQLGRGSHIWQFSTKKIITKLWENDSQSADGRTDRPYYIISQQNIFLHGENIKNEL